MALIIATSGTFRPFSKNLLTASCRRSWKRNSKTPALRLRRSHASLSALAEIVITLEPQCGMSLITLRARGDKGTVRGNPFLCVSQDYGASLEVHIIPPHRKQLAPSHPRLDGQLDNGRKAAAA